MIHFEPRRIAFGRKPGKDQDDDGDMPTPTRVRLSARRTAALSEAKGILDIFPEPGEALHCLTSRRLDLTDFLDVLFERMGPCDRMLCATLGYNKRSLKALLRWIDAGTVGSLSLVASKFFRSHNGALWVETLEQLHKRGARAASTDSHAKVCCLYFASGERMCLEGSQNLAGNGSVRENLALIRSDALTDWHSRWIEDLLVRYEGKHDGETES